MGKVLKQARKKARDGKASGTQRARGRKRAS
jgi:hypothetical protein